MNWEENRELGVVGLHIFNSRISNSRKIPGPKKRELGGHTVLISQKSSTLVFSGKKDTLGFLLRAKNL